VRVDLGRALRQAGRAQEAELVYREALRRDPENGWALFGLRRSLQAQGREADARAVEVRFRAAWRGRSLPEPDDG
jgi:cytochrome c-type biogenesis protein CcmH/NrfG